jgi:hypothetical protein
MHASPQVRAVLTLIVILPAMMRANGITVGSSPSKSGVMIFDDDAVDSEQDDMITDYDNLSI